MNDQHKQKIGAANHARFVKLQDRKTLALIVSMYVAKKSLTEIASVTGKSVMTVYRWVKWSGTPMRKLGDMHRGRNWTAARRAHNPK